MSKWEDVDPDDDSPFGVTPVDGIVYAHPADDVSPELRIAEHGYLAPPLNPINVGPAPTRPQRRSLGPWVPGGEVNPADYAPTMPKNNVIKPFLLGLIPIALVISLVLVVMHLYGMR